MALIARKLGVLILRSAGDGLYAQGVRITLPLEVEAVVDVASVERGPTGEVEEADCRLRGRFGVTRWDVGTLGHPYDDSGIEAGANAFLTSIGITARARWSRVATVSPDVIELVLESRAVGEIWPDLVTLPVRAMAR